jgi:hypothetical protein
VPRPKPSLKYYINVHKPVEYPKADLIVSWNGLGSASNSTFGCATSAFFVTTGTAGGGAGQRSFPWSRTIEPRTTSSSRFKENVSFPSP